MTTGKESPRTATARPARRDGEQGYVLLVLFLFSALLVIGFSRAMPSVFVQGQRDKEEELIFRGQQYQRAIQLFVRRFGRYPNSLEELEESNNIRFLRKQYPDPVTQEGEWRLIHIGPGGVFLDALNPPAVSLTPSTPGSSSEPGGSESQSAPGTQAPPQFPPGTSPTPIQIGSPGAGTGAAGQNPFTMPGLSSSANPNPAQQPRASGSAQGTAAQPVFGGGGIAGVASKNTGGSVKVWNNRSQYNEWEFIYDYRTDPIGAAAIARVSGPQQPQAPQTPPILPPGTLPQPIVPPAPGTLPPQFPTWLGTSPPGIRTPGQFPPSPIPIPPQPRPGQR